MCVTSKLAKRANKALETSVSLESSKKGARDFNQGARDFNQGASMLKEMILQVVVRDCQRVSVW